MPKIVDTHASKTHLASRSLPRGVVHGANAFALVWKYPDRVLTALCLNDRPGDIIQNRNVRTIRFECFGWYHKDTATDFGYGNLPTPLQATDIAFAQAGVDGE
jgi:hypothetical protein